MRPWGWSIGHGEVLAGGLAAEHGEQDVGRAVASWERWLRPVEEPPGGVGVPAGCGQYVDDLRVLVYGAVWRTPPRGETAIAVTDNDVVESTSQIIVALDCDNRPTADEIVERLGEECRFYKVGLEILTAVGPDFIKGLVARGKDVFLDLKLFEIQNSVAGAVRAAGALGVSMVTVHSMGGAGIMTAAVDAARDFPGLRILALTVVTSMTDKDLADIGVSASTEEQVLRLARLAEKAGCHGVIASPPDVAALRSALGSDALIVTPGVMLPGDSPAEHARPGTPRAALTAGASHVVVGRTITRATDPAAAFRLVRTSIAS